MNEKNKKQQAERPLAVAKNIARLLAIVMRASPLYVIGFFISALVMAAFGALTPFYTARLLNTLDSGGSFADALLVIGVTAIVYIALSAFTSLFWKFFSHLWWLRMHERLTLDFFYHTRACELGCYDDPRFYNEFSSTLDDVTNRANQVLHCLKNTIACILSVGALVTLLLTIDVWVALIIFGNAVYYTIVIQRKNKLQFKQKMEYRAYSRRANYYKRVFYLAEYAKELRMGHAGEMLMSDFDENIRTYIDADHRYAGKYFMYFGILNSLVTTVVEFSVIGYMAACLWRGEVQIGSFAAAIGVIYSIRYRVNTIITSASELSQHSMFVDKYLKFRDYRPSITDGPLEAPPLESIELRDVTFRYDFRRFAELFPDETIDEEKAEKAAPPDVLSHVSLKIRRGEKIAIVGYNGAGKTTLTKLLMRFYDPSEGTILYNGVDLREYNLASLRARIGAVFQDYHIFATSVAENVMNAPYEPERDRETVTDALAAAGFDTEGRLGERGIDATLTREFDDEGIMLSGGETQKIVIASVFAGAYDLMIMDEPSSALDPIAEYQLNHAIAARAEDHTVIFIAHRLSTTRMADRIYMFSGGEIVEQGSHEELLAADGAYAEMFRLQSEKYREGTDFE